MEEKLEELKTLAEKTVPNPNFAKAIENVINIRKKLEELNSELSKTMSNEIVQNNLKKQIHEATTELEFNSSYLMTFMPLEMENKIAHDPAMKEYVLKVFHNQKIYQNRKYHILLLLYSFCFFSKVVSNY